LTPKTYDLAHSWNKRGESAPGPGLLTR